MTTRAPELIALAEASLSRRPEIESERDEPFTVSTSPMDLPTDCREVRSLYFDDGTRQGPIELTSPEKLALQKGIGGFFSTTGGTLLTGYPRMAAVTLDGTRLILGPVPDQAYVLRLIYVTKLAPLSGGVNWLLTNHPDIYLYAALMEAAPYLRDDERIPVWERRLEKGLAELRALKMRQRFPGTLRIRPRRAIG